MKQFSTILLLVLILAQTFSKCWVVLGFTINQERIAATLCENRARPMLHCNGKCFLAKQLARQAKEESGPLNNGGLEKFEVVLLEQSSFANPFQLQRIVPLVYPSYTAAVLQRDATGIFHPPRV